MLWKIIRLLVMMIACGLITGCDSDSDSSQGEFESFVFINDTDENIRVFRDGGIAWIGSENFGLEQRGEERTVQLVEKGIINFGFVVVSFGNVKTEFIGNTIFFRNS